MMRKEVTDTRRVLFTVATPQVEAVAMVAHHEHRYDPLHMVVVLATRKSLEAGWEDSFVSFLGRLEPAPVIRVVEIRDEASATDVVHKLESEISPLLQDMGALLDVLVDFTGGLAIHRLALLLYATRVLPSQVNSRMTVLYADPAVRGVRRVPWNSPLAGEEVEELKFEISLDELFRLHGYLCTDASPIEQVHASCTPRMSRILHNLYELALRNPVARGFLARTPRKGRSAPGRVALEMLTREELQEMVGTLMSHEVVYEAMKAGFSEMERAGLNNGAEKAASVLRALVYEAIQGEYATDFLVSSDFLDTDEGREAVEEFVSVMESPPDRGGVGARYNREDGPPMFQDFRLPEDVVECLGSWRTGVLFEALMYSVLHEKGLTHAWANVRVSSGAHPHKCVSEYDLVGIHPDGRAFAMEFKAIRAPISGMRRELVSKMDVFRNAVGRYGEGYLILPFLQEELNLIRDGGRPSWLSPHSAGALREWLLDPHFPFDIKGLDAIYVWPDA